LYGGAVNKLRGEYRKAYLKCFETIKMIMKSREEIYKRSYAE
jgi:hypothetical protein